MIHYHSNFFTSGVEAYQYVNPSFPREFLSPLDCQVVFTPIQNILRFGFDPGKGLLTTPAKGR